MPKISSGSSITFKIMAIEFIIVGVLVSPIALKANEKANPQKRMVSQ